MKDGFEVDFSRIKALFETRCRASCEKSNLLVVEDETRLAESLKEGLEEEGYTVDLAYDGEEGETLALTHAYDALIVDWRLPRQDGRTLIRRLRAQGQPFPILMLTALGDLDHRVAGLDAGADDYLCKPFDFEELLARLRALLRRVPSTLPEPWLHMGSLKIDSARRKIVVNRRPLILRPLEYTLLVLLVQHREHVLSRTVIAERVWGSSLYVSDNVIDVTISTLRKKLSDALEYQAKDSSHPAEPRVTIETIRGVGYRIAVVE
jgi:DNA-binding response OmpR family regulator